MRRLKQLLLNILGEKRYLSLVASAFQKIYPTGWLGKEYQDIYFLKKFIRKGDLCIDIGAHLGYFSLELSRLVSDSGRVLAVEPMSKFNRILQRLLISHRIQNVEIFPVALGGKGEYVEMGIPQVNYKKKFAYARVIASSPDLQYIESEKVKNESGDDLFKGLARIDFIKCDVEGLEVSVFTSMLELLRLHLPILLCEFFDANERLKLYELLVPMGYQVYTLTNDKWTILDVYAKADMSSQNYYFIPREPRERLAHLFTQ